MKNIFTSLILLVGLNSLAQTDNCCINPEWINPNAICIMLWDPVIGCDAIEYSNSCVATAAGVTSWTYQSGAQEVMEWDCQNLGTLCTSLNGAVSLNLEIG